ncbi:acyltransferase family protein [Thermosipho ferrireducens]|uniref:Acyltransferase family protein n=1 Tax=Thermosipho ferrireducens TaxID=2571116 RepID=A0ABX7S5N5_9BACT|nr:acyltransferase family protein [Thermosipho ferrireducens]QTA37864.1 acyltransferase family protein [Thermosipho ferrireducens]
MRIETIDYARGLLIIAVVLAHSMVPEGVFAFISYLLSAFLFISGYLYKDYGFYERFKKLFKGILIPYFFMAFFNLLIFEVFNLWTGVYNSPQIFLNFFKHIFLGLLDDLGSVPVTVIPLWYLYMFFVAEMLFLIMKKLKIVHLIPVMSILFTYFGNSFLVFKISVAFHGLIYFYLGWLLKRRGFNFKFKVPWLYFILSLSGIIFLININGNVDWQFNFYGKNPLISYFVEFLWIILTISGACLIKTKFLKRIFLVFGRNTLFVLGYHITIPAIFLYPLFSLFGDPVAIAEKLWIVYFILDFSLIYFIINFLPDLFLNILSGQFYLLKFQEMPLEK